MKMKIKVMALKAKAAVLNAKTKLVTKVKKKIASIFKKGLAWNFPSLSGRRDIGGNAHMFVQDMSIAIAPIGGRSANSGSTFSYQVNGTDSAAVIAILREMDSHGRHKSVTEICCDVINNISNGLFYYGVVYYRLSHEQGKQTLSYVTSKRLFRLFGWYIQFIPRQDRSTFKTLLFIEKASNVVVFRLGEAPFSSFLYRMKLSLLSRFTTSLAPKFYTDNPLNNNFEFDVKHFGRLRALFSSLVTKGFYWQQRSALNSSISEFYLVHRYYKNEALKADLRVKILKQLNDSFRALGFSVVIEEAGLLSSKDIQVKLNKIESGEAEMMI